MMTYTNNISTILLAFAISMTMLLAGCDNPAGDDDHDEHAEPRGLQLVMNGDVIWNYLNGEASDDHIDLEAGSETDLITIEWLDQDGDEIHAEDLDDEFGLGWEIANEDIASVEQHSEDGPWSFHLHGESAGETTMQIMLMHGDHADFSTPGVDQQDALQIHVEEQTQ